VTAAKMDSPDSIRAIGDAMIEENSAQTATVALADSASFSVTTDDPSQISLTGNDGKSSQKRRVDPPGKTSAAPLAQKLKSAQQNNSWSNS